MPGSGCGVIDEQLSARGSGGRRGEVVSDGRTIAKLRRVVAFNVDCVEIDVMDSGSKLYVVLLSFLGDIVKRLSLNITFAITIGDGIYSVGV